MTFESENTEEIQNRIEETAANCIESFYWEWFCSIPGIYRRHREILLRCFGDPKGVWQAEAGEWKHLKERGCDWVGCVETHQKESDPQETVYKNRQLGIQFTSCEQSDYPKLLRSIRDFPYGIFYKGRLPAEEKKQIAVVGARVCTHYGKHLAEQLAGQIAQAGGEVVSGAAYGIDGAAQWAALSAGGASFAVVGGGVDCRYPRANDRLYDRLEEEGGVLSEFPPGTKPLRYHFPLRNRIISGLSEIVTVIEAKHGSGSLITADYALEQGRTVLAVPGRLDDELSRGCNELIAQGAGVILSPESFAEQVFPDFRQQKKNKVSDIALAPSEKLVYSSLDLHSKSLWELEECTSLSLADLSGSLLALEARGLIREVERNYYVKVR
ncbi:MAG: DNA-processing protein DprA [Lachnospiraceae bacterium]